MRFYLLRTNHEFKTLLGCFLYIPFVVLWTVQVLSWRHSSAYYLASGIVDIIANGEWDQGPEADDLYFRKSWEDVAEAGAGTASGY